MKGPWCHKEYVCPAVILLRPPKERWQWQQQQEEKNGCDCVTEEDYCCVVFLLQQSVHILVDVSSGVLTL